MSICSIFGSVLGGLIGGFIHLDITEVILMHLVVFIILGNLYFTTKFIKLSTIEKKLWLSNNFGRSRGAVL